MEELGRAGWAHWESEPTCSTANAQRPRRIDQAPEMQARLLNVELSWAAGIKTRAWKQGVFRASPPDQFKQWLLGDAGPAEGEEGFSGLEF